MRLKKLTCLTAAVLTLAACQRAGDDDAVDPLLARAGAATIRVSDFDAFLARPPDRAHKLDRAVMRSALDKMIDEQLSRDAAQALGVGNESNVVQSVRAALAMLEQDRAPAENEIQAYYETQKERFLSRRVLLDVLEFADHERAAGARARLDALGVQPATGFAPNLDERDRATRLGWVTRTGAPPEVKNAIMTLQRGKPVFSAVGQDGIARIYLLRGEQQNVPRTLNEVRDQLIMELRKAHARERWQALLDERRDAVHIDASAFDALVAARVANEHPGSVRVRVPRPVNDDERATRDGH